MVLPGCPTSRGRASSPCVHGLRDAVCDARHHRQPRDLPVPARGAFAHARGLRPRGVPARLAMAARRMWPSAHLYGVGTPKWPRFTPWVIAFTAQYPACTFPCQRFAGQGYPRPRMTRGRCGSLLLQRLELASITPRRFSPAHIGSMKGLSVYRTPVMRPPSPWVGVPETPDGFVVQVVSGTSDSETATTGPWCSVSSAISRAPGVDSETPHRGGTQFGEPSCTVAGSARGAWVFPHMPSGRAGMFKGGVLSRLEPKSSRLIAITRDRRSTAL